MGEYGIKLDYQVDEVLIGFGEEWEQALKVVVSEVGIEIFVYGRKISDLRNFSSLGFNLSTFEQTGRNICLRVGYSPGMDSVYEIGSQFPSLRVWSRLRLHGLVCEGSFDVMRYRGSQE
jgi:hypothetical protein